MHCSAFSCLSVTPLLSLSVMHCIPHASLWTPRISLTTHGLSLCIPHSWGLHSLHLSLILLSASTLSFSLLSPYRHLSLLHSLLLSHCTHFSSLTVWVPLLSFSSHTHTLEHTALWVFSLLSLSLAHRLCFCIHTAFCIHFSLSWELCWISLCLSSLSYSLLAPGVFFCTCLQDISLCWDVLDILSHCQSLCWTPLFLSVFR